jgi:hypothetical protein
MPHKPRFQMAFKDICRTCDTLWPETDDNIGIEVCYGCGEDVCEECEGTHHKDCEDRDADF